MTAGMRDSFGIVWFSGGSGEMPGEKRKHYKPSMKELEARRWGSVCSPFS